MCIRHGGCDELDLQYTLSSLGYRHRRLCDIGNSDNDFKRYCGEFVDVAYKSGYHFKVV